MRSLVSVAALATLTLLVSACGDDAEPGAGEARLPVVATTTQAGDLVANVGGDRIELARLLAPNADPHDYEPRPSDAKALARAEVVVRSGGDLDEWLGDVIESAGSEPRVLDLIDRVETIEGGHHHEEEEHHDEAEEEHAEEDEEVDPHWWHDPRNAVRAVAAIRDALAAADPEGRATYEANAREYTSRLEDLDARIAACMDAVPADRRKLVTTHDALGYFAERYDIEVVGSVLDSLSTMAQPSAGDLRRLVDQMREEDVRVLFAERSVAPRLERAIAEEAGARVGDPLWADTLGPSGSSGDTYVRSMAANADALVRGFGGRGCTLAAAR